MEPQGVVSVSDVPPASASQPLRAFSRPSVRAFAQTLLGVGIALLWIWIAFVLHFNLAAAGFTQLFVVIVVASRAGFVQATAVSIIANICLDYFFAPPLGSLLVSDPRNWVALIVFEASALLVSNVSANSRRQTVIAKQHHLESERLYIVARDLLLLSGERPVASQLLELFVRTFHLEAALLVSASAGHVERVGPSSSTLETETRNACVRASDVDLPHSCIWVRVLRIDGDMAGALGFEGQALTTGIASALASLAALVLERLQSLERQNRAEAQRQTEQLRGAVLDALAHEYQTPLTAIRAATSGLLQVGHLNRTENDLISLIDSEITRLSGLTSRLLQMSRLDETEIQVRYEWIEVDELIRLLVSEAAKKAGERFTISKSTEGIRLSADRELIGMAVSQLLDNAAKYSDPGSPITISAATFDSEFRVAVHNYGPEIPLEERPKIFERFYRTAPNGYHASGSGLGLSITKKIVIAHQGRVWVTSEKSRGNTFFIALPIKGE